MNAQEKQIVSAEIVCVVLGRGDDFLLIDVDEPLNMNAVRRVAERRGLCFCGVMSYASGECAAQCEPGLEAIGGMTRAAFAFAQRVADKIRPKGESTEWLQRIYSLPDLRDN